MFFDKVGHNAKDLFIIVLMIFTYILSTRIIALNIRLDWWDKNGKATQNQDQAVNNQPIDWSLWLSGLFITITTLMLLYGMYVSFTVAKKRNII